MARGAAGERLSQLEAAIAQLGARLRRLEESSSARASALEQRLGRLEHSLARARHATPVPHSHPPQHDDDAHTTTSAARARAPPPPLPSSRSWELVRAARRGAALEVQRRLDGVAALRDGPLPLHDLDLHTNRSGGGGGGGGGRRSPLHSAARWSRADVGVAQLLLLEQPIAAALDENASKPLRLADSSATAHAVAAYW